MRADPAIAVSLALSGALLCIVLLRLLDLNEKEPIWALALLLWLGAVSAAGTALLFDADIRGDGAVAVALTAESAKLVALVCGFGLLAAIARRRGWSEVNGPVDGLVYGAAAGLGVAFCEGLLRGTFSSTAERQTADELDGWDVLSLTLQSGLSEAVFGAILGVGLVLMAHEPRRFRGALALVAAIAAAFGLHLAFTALMLSDAQITPSISTASLIAVAVALAAVAVVVRYGLRGEAELIVGELEDEVGSPALRESELALLRDPRARHSEYWRKFRHGDLEGYLLQRRLQDRQVQLALTKRRLATADDDAERRRLASQIGRLRESIEERRDDRRGGRRRREALVAGASILLIASGGIAIVATAAGEEPPTTVATRSELAAREADEANLPADAGALRDTIRHSVGDFRLAGMESDGTPVDRGAIEAYGVDYVGPNSRRVHHVVASFASSSAADDYARALSGEDAGTARRVWRDGRIVSVASGDQGAIDAFCVERQNLLPDFLSRIRRAVPPTWEAITPTRDSPSRGFTDPGFGANVLGSAAPYSGGTSETYAQAEGAALRRGLRGYDELSFERVDFRAGGGGFRREFRWNPPQQARVHQIQLYYVDECAMSYVFTATTLVSDRARREPLFDEIFSGLIASGADSSAP